MRVAIVTETFLPRMDGVVRMLLEFLTYLQNNGHDAVVIAPGQGPTTWNDVPVLRVRGIPFPLYPDMTLSPFSVHLHPVLRAWQPDIVHLASPFVLGQHAARVGRALHVPVVGHYQTDVAAYAQFYGLGPMAGLAWRWAQMVHQMCDLTICPTDVTAQQLQEHGIAPTLVIGRGVDTVLFHPLRRSSERRLSLAPSGGPVLLSVGRLSPEKNLATLLPVLTALPTATLVIVGDGPARASLESLFAPYRDRVVFLGYLSGVALAEVYASADIFLFPSCTETFGQVAQEAMAAGVPVVGMMAGGVPAVVQHRHTGLLCAPDSPSDLVSAVSLLLNDTALRQSLGGQARLHMETRSWTAIFDRMLTVYDDLIAGSHQKGDSAYVHAQAG